MLLWSTGAYLRDGAGNITRIGSDRFAYDLAGQMTRSDVSPQATAGATIPRYDIGYEFDAFGNTTRRFKADTQSAQLPQGMEFTRSFGASPQANKNQVVGDDLWAYDANGNQLRSSVTYSTTGMANAWDAMNRVQAVFTGSPGATDFEARRAPAERYIFGADGLRAVTFNEETDGSVVYSLRDPSGAVIGEWQERPGASQPERRKEYLHALGQQLVERTFTTVVPTTNAVAPFGTASGYGFQVTDSVGAGSYLADIRTDDGYHYSVGGIVPNSNNSFWLPASAFYPNVANYVRIRAEGRDDAAYSAPATITVDPTVNGSSPSQVRAVAVSRVGTNVVLRWAINQENGKKFRVWYHRLDTGTQVLISVPTGLASSTREFIIPSQGLQASCGALGVTQINTGGTETSALEADLPNPTPNDPTPNDPCIPAPPPPQVHAVDLFHHRDHLRSARVVTDVAGWPAQRYDYYPYGRQMVADLASETGETIFRYTGHERRGYVGQDYMFARVKSTSDVQFSSPDPIADVSRSAPTSWNDYAYVRNRPVQLRDPWGLAAAPQTVDPEGYIRAQDGSLVSWDAVETVILAGATPSLNGFIITTFSLTQATRTDTQVVESQDFGVTTNAFVVLRDGTIKVLDSGGSAMTEMTVRLRTATVLSRRTVTAVEAFLAEPSRPRWQWVRIGWQQSGPVAIRSNTTMTCDCVWVRRDCNEPLPQLTKPCGTEGGGLTPCPAGNGSDVLWIRNLRFPPGLGGCMCTSAISGFPPAAPGCPQ